MVHTALRTLFAMALSLSLATPDARAREERWLSFGAYSKHFGDSALIGSQAEYEQNNRGLGVEYRFDPTHRLGVGSFRNSFSKDSSYIAYGYTPLGFERLRAGVVAGVVTGYRRGSDLPSFALIPVLALEGRRFGINLTGVPRIGDTLDGQVTLQLKVRLD